MGLSHLPPARRLLIAALALFALLGIAIDRWKRRAPPAPEAVRLTQGGEFATEPAISADGKLVAYAADRGGGTLQIWVQPVGGAAWPITSGGSDHHSPAFSPDGGTVAYRAEEEDGGPGAVWSVPARGGTAKRVAEGGRDPRFSPDGKWLAWWTRTGQGQVWVGPRDGGPARRVCPACVVARQPVWTPDGRLVLFGDAGRGWDWLAARPDGGETTATGARRIFRLQDINTDVAPGAWARNGILFRGQRDSESNLWHMPMDLRTLDCTSGARQITFGTVQVQDGSAAADGTLVYASRSLTAAVWQLPLDLRRGTAAGEPGRVTTADPAHPLPSLSADAQRMAFFRDNRIWTKDLATGEETSVEAAGLNGRPVLSPDGARVAWGARGIIYAAPVKSGAPERLGGHGIPLEWHRTGILCQGWNRSILIADPANRRERAREFLRREDESIHQPRISPDGRWIALHTRDEHGRRVWIVPFRPMPPESDWIAITQENGSGRDPCWSGDGTVLYYLSERDGFRCVWAQKLEGAGKRPRGEPFAVRHFHEARRNLTNPRNPAETGIECGGGKLFVSLFESSGDIWRTRLPD